MQPRTSAALVRPGRLARLAVATLLATARRLEAAAVDDALDLFDSLMATRLIGPARRQVIGHQEMTSIRRDGRGDGFAGNRDAAQFLAARDV